MTIRDLSRRLDRLDAQVGPPTAEEAALSRRVFSATLVHRYATCLQLPAPPEADFMDSLPAANQKRLLPGGPLPANFAEILAQRLEDAAIQARNTPRRTPREGYEILVQELRDLNSAHESAGNGC